MLFGYTPQAATTQTPAYAQTGRGGYNNLFHMAQQGAQAHNQDQGLNGIQYQMPQMNGNGRWAGMGGGGQMRQASLGAMGYGRPQGNLEAWNPQVQGLLGFAGQYGKDNNFATRNAGLMSYLSNPFGMFG